MIIVYFTANLAFRIVKVSSKTNDHEMLQLIYIAYPAVLQFVTTRKKSSVDHIESILREKYITIAESPTAPHANGTQIHPILGFTRDIRYKGEHHNIRNEVY